MLDPLVSFDWSTLYERYESQCRKDGGLESGAAEYLGSFQPTPKSDRELYQSLIERFASSRSAGIPLSVYEAMLFWKLYSQRGAVKKHCKRLRDDVALRESTTLELIRISKALPPNLAKDVDEIVRVLTSLTTSLHGMAWSCAIPVRTTFLHFMYPDVVPIFDKQVLKAVGIEDKDANHSYEILRDYIPHAWSLAETYQEQFTTFPKETPIRVVDMALWVARGRGARQ